MTTRIESLQEEIKKLQQQLKKGASSDLAGTFDKLLASATKTGDVSVLVGEIPGGPMTRFARRSIASSKKAGSCVVVVAGSTATRSACLAAVSDDVVKKGVQGRRSHQANRPNRGAAAAAAALIWPRPAARSRPARGGAGTGANALFEQQLTK